MASNATTASAVGAIEPDNGETVDLRSQDNVVTTEVIHPEAQGFVALVTAVLAVALIALAPLATRAAPMTKGWWVEPRTWPLICLSVTLIAAGYQAVRWWQSYRSTVDHGSYWRKSLWAFGELRTAFEYAAYFIVYLVAVGHIGFAIASFVFMQLVIWRAGLRTARWRIVAGLFVIGVVLAFRVGLGLWFPLPSLFSFAPGWFVNTVGIYL